MAVGKICGVCEKVVLNDERSCCNGGVPVNTGTQAC
jgi:hypothetical protein